jgi:hypothetical protein
MRIRAIQAMQLWVSNEKRRCGNCRDPYDSGYWLALDNMEKELAGQLEFAKEQQRQHDLFGKRVRVTMEYAKNDAGPIVTEGTFLGYGEGGDIEILEDDQFIHYCWPALNIEEVTDNGEDAKQA